MATHVLNSFEKIQQQKKYLFNFCCCCEFFFLSCASFALGVGFLLHKTNWAEGNRKTILQINTYIVALHRKKKEKNKEVRPASQGLYISDISEIFRDNELFLAYFS